MQVPGTSQEQSFDTSTPRYVYRSTAGKLCSPHFHLVSVHVLLTQVARGVGWERLEAPTDPNLDVGMVDGGWVGERPNDNLH